MKLSVPRMRRLPVRTLLGVGTVCSVAVVLAASSTATAAREELQTSGHGSGAAVVVQHRCGACHLDLPQPREKLPARARAARSVYDALASQPHPDFALSDAERLAIALAAGGTRLDRELGRLRRAHDEATAEAGAAMMRGLNCGGCHADLPTGVAPAPPLRALAAGTRAAWLRAYLRTPHALRPFGARPGTGSRMPRFTLTPEEADSIGAFLRPQSETAATAPKVSQHAAETADVLLDRLSCRGCHSYRGRGGRIGPALDSVHVRRTPEYIASIIRDPARVQPGAPMPRVTDVRVERVIALLAGGDPRPGSRSVARTYLSPLEHALLPYHGNDQTRFRYTFWCAACHGADGRADGYNAAFLDVRPARHADAAEMSLRPDDTLHDGIAAGGAALGRSPAMPPFGGVLSAGEIRELVTYIRTLCDCRGPAWSERRQ